VIFGPVLMPYGNFSPTADFVTLSHVMWLFRHVANLKCCDGELIGYPSYTPEKEVYAGERISRTKRLDAIKRGATVAPILHPRFFRSLFFPPYLVFVLEYSI
jgi:hypothetical protein